MSDCEVQAMEDYMSQPLPTTDFDDWWELVGSNMKNQPGENIYDTELPHRVAIAAWKAGQGNLTENKKELEKATAPEVGFGALLDNPLLDEIIKRAFNNGANWGETYKGWFIPSIKETKKEIQETQKRIKRWLKKDA